MHTHAATWSADALASLQAQGLRNGGARRAVVEHLGAPAWTSDPQYATLAGRRAAHDLLDEKLGAWTAEIDLDKAIDLLIGADIPAAPVYDGRLSSQHPQFVARHYYEELEHPIIGVQAHPSLPFRYASVDRWLHTSSPMLGQHNHEILSDLGLSAEEIAALEADDQIGTIPLGL